MVRPVTDVSEVLLVTLNTRHLNVAKSSNAKHPSFRENHKPDPFVCFEAMNTFDVFFTPGYILIEINGEKILNTADLSTFDNNIKINQMTFMSPDGEKERLIFE